MITNFYYALWANLFLEEDNPLRSTVQTQYNTGSSSLISDMAFRMFSDNIEDKEVIISNLSHFLLYAIFRCIPKPRLVQSLSKNLLFLNVECKSVQFSIGLSKNSAFIQCVSLTGLKESIICL